MNLSRLDSFIIAIGVLIASIDAAQLSFLSRESRDATTNNATTFDVPEIDYRLPRTVQPQSYDIKLFNIKFIPELNSSGFTFEGIVQIQAIVVKNVTEIVLHAGNLNIQKVNVVNMVNVNDNLYKPPFNHLKSKEKLIIPLVKTVPANTLIVIPITYQGVLSDTMTGFYRSSYRDADNKLRWLAATQFESTAARHAFPCFDEPDFKAVFKIAISRDKRPKEYTSISNMPVAKTLEISGAVWDHFESSVPMSTYLVGFVISDFNRNEKGNIRGWARPSAVNQTEYAITVASQAKKYFENLLQMDYSLSKMDMVALPDFAPGAMENWGLITYRESRMLYDYLSSSDMARQDIGSVVVHEYCHMWFGNLVTPAWWGYVWLSEGFARYFQYKAMGKIQNEWNMEGQFVVDQQTSAYAIDGVETSRPLSRNPSNEAEVAAMGDGLAYSKGASIIRMMNLFLGDRIFNAALKDYIKDRANSTAIPDDLWKFMQNQVNSNQWKLPKPVNNIMENWTLKSGYPVVTVSVDEEGDLRLKQDRFLLRNFNSQVTDKTLWWVPITFATKSKPDFNVANMVVKNWLHEKSLDLKVGLQSDEWVVLNVQSSGFYRVNYAPTLWKRIIKVLNGPSFTDIHELNRAAIIDDLINLARAGLVDYTTVLEGLQYLKQERSYVPFKAALNAVDHLNRWFLEDELDKEVYRHYMLSLIRPAHQELGWDDLSTDSWMKLLLRQELNKITCKLNDKYCKERWSKDFTKWQLDTDYILPKNHRFTVYCMGVKYGSPEAWEFLWSKYLKENSPTEKDVMLKALGCTTDEVLLEKYLNHAIKSYEEGGIRRQDSSSVFSAVGSSSLQGANYVIHFIDSHFAEMQKYHGNSGIAQILKKVSEYLTTASSIGNLEKFINTQRHKLEDVLPVLNEALKVAKSDLLWYNKNSRSIMSFIKRQSDHESYVLPEKINPEKYEITVEPSFDTMTFKGTVNIRAKVIADTRDIFLHSTNLTYHWIAIGVERGMTIEVVEPWLIEEYDMLQIKMKQELKKNTEINIEIRYTGYLNNKNLGFYRTSYIKRDDESALKREKWIAATHLQPVNARRMFPCFDHPKMKAIFQLTAIVPKNYHALSNTRLEKRTSLADHRSKYKFEETPVKMSTYLLALVVSDFKSLSTDLNSEKKCSVWARQNVISEANYSLQLIPPIVKHFENLFQINYELAKLDMIALPDLPMGAMENWGLLTYRESQMLYNDKHMSLKNKQSITNVIVHELSHQWFGNLVTPVDWRYLWLSEGFARYFQYLSGFELSAGWSLETQFVVDQVHTALAMDSLMSSEAMNQVVYTPAQMENKFDGISYNKAASVIRMLENLIGRESFYKGLRQYLQNRKHNNAHPDQLYDALQNALEVEQKYDIKKFMDSWTNEAGYPVVDVEVDLSTVKFTQERFLVRKSGDGSPMSPVWKIPITWRRKNNIEQVFLLDKKQDVLKLNDMDGEKCMIFNIKQTGFYRVNYDQKYWKNIISCLNDRDYRMIPEINRAALLDDLFNLGRVDKVDYNIVLGATKYLTKETAYAPWRAFFNGMKYLHDRFSGQDIYQPYKRYLSAMLEQVHWKIGHQESHLDSYSDKLLRPHVFEWMCRIGDPMCDKISNDFSQDKFIVPADLRGTFYCYKVQNSSEMVTSLWASYRDSDSATEKMLILRSLACSTDTKVITDLMNKAILEDSEIRYQDSPEVFSSIGNNLQILPDLMLFIKDNHKRMIQYYGGYSQLKVILSDIAGKVSTQELLDKYESLIRVLKEKIPDLGVSLNADLARARYEMQWYKSHSTQMRNWLESNYENNYDRLPNDFTPKHYDIYIAPDLEPQFVFRGDVSITMVVNKDSSFVALHADQLEILSLKAYIHDPVKDLYHSLEAIGASYTVFPKQQVLLITFERKLPRGTEVEVVIEYSGNLNKEKRGFYRESFVDSEGRVRWIAATKFKPTYARKAFPCFDEPAFKATFSVQIERPSVSYTSLSNMQRSSSYPINKNRICDVYGKSNLMSTYMLSFVVLDMAPIETTAQDIRVWGRPNFAVYAENIPLYVQEMMKTMEWLLDMKQPQQKLDLIGVPYSQDVAVEQWGVVTYREDVLFGNNLTTPSTQLAYSNRSIIRGLTHTWFGNLVTCEWWNYAWVQEGFAEYFQWLLDGPSDDYSSPTKYFAVDVLQDVMRFEDNHRFDKNHALNGKITARSEIENIFDIITSKKAASVLRMIHLTFGNKAFWTALQKYLKQHQHSTANPKDLWNSFTEESIVQAFDDDRSHYGDDMTMEKIMNAWTNMKGYPIVNVTHKEGGIITFSQIIEEKDDGYYWIPITLTSAKNPNFMATTPPKLWLGDKERFSNIEPMDWFVVNVQQAGYYRVNYDMVSWNRLINALNSENYHQIHVINRAQIIDDLFSLARREYIHDWRMIIRATRYLAHEEEYLPWKAFFNGFGFLTDHIRGKENYTLLTNHILSLTNVTYQSISFSNSSQENDDKELLKDLILRWVCKFDHKHCVDNSYHLFLSWSRDPLQNPVPLNLRAAVYCTSMRHGTKRNWEFLMDQYMTTNFPTDKVIILKALGCTSDVATLRWYLNATLSSKMDEKIVFPAVYSSGPIGATVFLQWFMEEFRSIYHYYGNWKSVGNLLSEAAQYITTEKQLMKLEQFILANAGDLQKIMEDLHETIKNVRDSHQWVQKHSQNIIEAFVDESVPPKPETSNAAVSHNSNILFFISIVTTVILCYLFH